MSFSKSNVAVVRRTLVGGVFVLLAALAMAACGGGGGGSKGICDRCQLNESNAVDCYNDCIDDCFTTVCLDECADRCDGCGMDLECVGCTANCQSLSTRRCAPQTDFISCTDGIY